MRSFLLIKAGLFIFLLYTTSVLACTTIFQNTGSEQVVARSMDLYTSDEPQLYVYPRGQKRFGGTGKNTLSWKSRYGSVVVTAFGASAVSDGMNEEGLAAHLLYLTNTQYPQSVAEAPALSNIFWALYMLDHFKTVSEAVKAASKLNIVATEVHGRTWPAHLALEDQTGDSAIFEYVDGKLHIYHGKQYQIMTNEPPFDIQLANLKKYKSFGGNLPIPGYPDPISRFVRASYYIKTLPHPKTNLEALAGTLSVMRSAMVPFGAVDESDSGTEDAWPTRWVSLADLKNKVYYFNSTTTPNIVWLDLSALNFSEGAPIQSMNPNQVGLVGNVNKMLH